MLQAGTGRGVPPSDSVCNKLELPAGFDGFSPVGTTAYLTVYSLESQT
jgi:hypothetical protein